MAISSRRRARLAALPPMRGVEIAFAGRSNVGKSSLINALTGRNALARTSRTPGRTQELIFFSGPGDLTLVDMPGYGYAAAAKTKIKAWTVLIHQLPGRSRQSRARLCPGRRPPRAQGHRRRSAQDARPGGGELSDRADQGRPVTAAGLEAVIAATEAALARHPAAYPSVLTTSARDGAGIPELRATIMRLTAERLR